MNERAESTVGEVVGELLERLGVDTVFGIASIHNLPILDGLHRRPKLRFVMARGEAGAANMADAYARISGRLGVLLTSTGPACANAMGGLLEAAATGSPLLHLTGQVPSTALDLARGGTHDAPGQLAMLAATGKKAYRVHAPGRLVGTLLSAVQEALTPPCGVVSVEIPIDIQKARLPAPDLGGYSLAPPAPVEPEPADLARLARLLSEARRPVLWVGHGAARAGAAVAALAELGVAVLTTVSARGVVPETHPMVLGAFGATPEVVELLQSADLLLMAGARPRAYEIRDAAFDLPDCMVHIDVDPLVLGRVWPARGFVRGDAALVLERLVELVRGRAVTTAEYRAEVASVKATTLANYRVALGPQAKLAELLRQAMPADAVLVRDLTLATITWGNRFLPLSTPQSSIFPAASGMGQGLPMAVGAALAAGGRKVVAVCGDGGFMVNLGELWTAAQEKANVLFLVLNDRGYGSIRNMQDVDFGGRRFGTELLTPDFCLLARSAGLPAERVTSLDAASQALPRLMAHQGPALLEIDVDAVGPLPSVFAGGGFDRTRPLPRRKG